MAAEVEATLTVGFPLVMFVQQGSMRAAPLFSRGGSHARWKLGEAPWKLPAGARPGATLTLPDALEIELGSDRALRASRRGVALPLRLDGAALGSIAAAGRAGSARSFAQRRARSRPEVRMRGPKMSRPRRRPPDRSPAKTSRRSPRRRCVVPRRRAGSAFIRTGSPMLPPRGDPTSGLRSDLQAVLGETLPPRGPLAVYLGAPGAPPRKAPIFTTGKVLPTPSQLAAARCVRGERGSRRGLWATGLRKNGAPSSRRGADHRRVRARPAMVERAVAGLCVVARP